MGIRSASVDELLADSSIDLVVNLTIPRAHAVVNMAALNAGNTFTLRSRSRSNPAKEQRLSCPC